MMTMMERPAVRLSRLPRTTRLFVDFLDSFPKVSDYYSHSDDETGLLAAVGEARSKPPENLPALVEILRVRNAALGADESVKRNLDRLRDGAVAVITGQQAGLFGGPAYTIYKAATAIHWAHWLTAHGIEAVPLFWIASEDHDFAEVSHVEWLSREGTRRLEISPEKTTLGGPVGDIPLGPAIDGVTASAVKSLDGPHAEEIADVLRASYRAEETLGGAFGNLMARLFAGYGLILLDPRDAGIHRLAAPVLRRAAEKAELLTGSLLKRGKELEAAGYHAQVKVTPQSTLLFRIVDGKREPVRRRGGDYTAGKSTFSREELLTAIDQRPEDFSPNALLRPVVQDAMLPTAAYIGGAAEIAYFAQSSVIYREFGVRMPALLPRASFTLVDARTARILRKYGLNVEDFFAGGQSVRRKMELRSLPRGLAHRFRMGEKNLGRMLKTLRPGLRRLDPTLVGALDSAQRKMTHQYGKLSAKAGRAEGLREGVLERHLKLLTDMLYPAKGLQERTLSALPFMAMAPEKLTDTLLEIIRQKGAAEHHVVDLR